MGAVWRLVLPPRIGNWPLTSLQQRLAKTGGRLMKHARCYWLLRAEGHLARRVFGARRIAALPVPARQPQIVGSGDVDNKQVNGGAVSEESSAAKAVPELMNDTRPNPDSFRGRLWSPGRKAELKQSQK